jgi:tetratricopeptide (TPR) repeat protein
MELIPDWYISVIEKFREKGFFESESKESVASRIISESKESYCGDILRFKDDPLFEQVFSSYDTKKVWFIEDWMMLGSTEDFENNFYLNVFHCLAKISDSKFLPEKIEVKECGYCQGRDKRLNIAFSLNNNSLEVNFCIDSDVLVINFLEEINDLIATEGFSFQSIMDPYGKGFILFLSQKQKDWLIEELHWKFDSYSNYWLDRAQFSRDSKKLEDAHKYFQKAILYKNEPFAISEFASFLVDQKKNNEAAEVFELGIRNLKNMECLNEKQIWWLNMFQSELNKLN